MLAKLQYFTKSRNSLVLASFLIITAITLWPILSNQYLPLVDISNHIARHYILTYGESSILSQYYTANFAIVPNSAADLIWYLCSEKISVVAFSQFIMAGYAVNLIASIIVLSRIINGYWSLWPLTAALMVFNGNFFWGFQNFLFSVPFAIWGLSLWFLTEKYSTKLRLIVFIPFVALLYFMHFFAFAAMAIMIFGREIQLLGLAEKNLRKQVLSQGLIMSVPFLLPVMHLIFEKLVGDLSRQSSFTKMMSSTNDQLNALLSILSYSQDSFRVKIISLILILGMLCLFMTTLFKLSPRLGMDSRMKGPIFALTVAAFCSPSWLNDVALVHIRLPFIIIILMIASTHWVGLTQRTGLALAMIITIIIFGRSLQVENMASRHTAEVREFIEVIQNLPEGARLLPLRAPGKAQSEKRLNHLQAYAVIERHAYVPTLFQGVHMLSVKEPWRRISHPHWRALDIIYARNPEFSAGYYAQPQYWTNWQQDFTHAVLLDPIDKDLIEDLPLHKISEKGRFTLFEIKN